MAEQWRPIASIRVGPRMREDFGDLDGLAESIREHGLLHPVVIDQHGNLIAGERRLRACRLLGWDEVPVRDLGEVPQEERQEIELEENLYRKDFSSYELDKNRVLLAQLVEKRRKRDAHELELRQQRRQEERAARKKLERRLLALRKRELDAEARLKAVLVEAQAAQQAREEAEKVKAAEEQEPKPVKEAPELVKAREKLRTALEAKQRLESTVEQLRTEAETAEKELKEMQKTADQEVIPPKSEEEHDTNTRHDGAMGDPGSRKDVARQVGIPEATLRRAEQHVEVAQRYPLLQGKAWEQGDALEAGRALDLLSDDDRQLAIALLEEQQPQAKSAIAAAVAFLRHLTLLSEDDRASVFAEAELLDEPERRRFIASQSKRWEQTIAAAEQRVLTTMGPLESQRCDVRARAAALNGKVLALLRELREMDSETRADLVASLDPPFMRNWKTTATQIRLMLDDVEAQLQDTSLRLVEFDKDGVLA